MKQDETTPGIERFLEAQNAAFWQGMTAYETALEEIMDGEKLSHWIWYIFPQLYGLGFSSMCERYGIRGLEEAKEYLKNETLKFRLVEISSALLKHGRQKTAEQILGGIDSVKVRSCMTLFAEAAWDNGLIAEYEQFIDVLEAFYGGEHDQWTLNMINCKKKIIKDKAFQDKCEQARDTTEYLKELVKSHREMIVDLQLEQELLIDTGWKLLKKLAFMRCDTSESRQFEELLTRLGNRDKQIG